jgi:hypothetical protein
LRIGVDTVGNGNAGDGRTGLQAFLNNLGFERFGVRASLAHENPDVKGYCVRLKIREHHRPQCWSSEGVLAGRLPREFNLLRLKH